ncbi:MAG: hypothetical protein ACREP7_08450 [Lysobacter sp.]
MSPASIAGPHAPSGFDPERLAETMKALAKRLTDGGDEAVDAYLDGRDSDPFDTQWVGADAALRSHKSRLDAERVARTDAESAGLRQRIFAAVIQTSGHADLAGYLADDAALIYENDSLNFGSDWIDSLRGRYESQQLPPEPAA